MRQTKGRAPEGSWRDQGETTKDAVYIDSERRFQELETVRSLPSPHTHAPLLIQARESGDETTPRGINKVSCMSLPAPAF